MLPSDPFILLSYVNTLLRDEYASFSELGDSLGEDCDEIRKKLENAGFYYDEKANRFR